MPRGRPPQPATELGRAVTARQAHFISALLSKEAQLRPEAAARMVGVEEKQAGRWARLMLEAAPVRKALTDHLAAQIEAAQATPTRWLAEVARLALGDLPSLRDFYREDGTLIPPTEWTAEMSAQVAELHTDEVWGRGEERGVVVGYTRKIKLHPRYQTKLAALEMLAKYHKLYADLTINQNVVVTERPEEDQDAKARAARAALLAAIGATAAPEPRGELH